jgi:hypothetical protein
MKLSKTPALLLLALTVSSVGWLCPSGAAQSKAGSPGAVVAWGCVDADAGQCDDRPTCPERPRSPPGLCRAWR